MRTTLDVDEKLLADVVKATGEKSKSKAVRRALEGYLRGARVAELRAMLGNTDVLDNWYELRHLEPR